MLQRTKREVENVSLSTVKRPRVTDANVLVCFALHLSDDFYIIVSHSLEFHWFLRYFKTVRSSRILFEKTCGDLFFYAVQFNKNHGISQHQFLRSTSQNVLEELRNTGVERR